MSITERDPPGWPEPAWRASVRSGHDTRARSTRDVLQPSVELLHESRDFVDSDAGDGDLGRVHDLVGGPDDRALHVLGDPGDVVQERGDVVVDPDRVGLER